MSEIKIFRKVNAKCQIKGCRSNGRKVDTFYVSASEGYGPSAILCEGCIKSLYERLTGKNGCDYTEFEKKLEAALAENEQLKTEIEQLKAENKETSDLLKKPDADEADEENPSDGDADTSLYTKEEDAEIEADDEDKETTENTENTETTEAPVEEAVDKAPEKAKKARSKKAEME